MAIPYLHLQWTSSGTPFKSQALSSVAKEVGCGAKPCSYLQYKKLIFDKLYLFQYTIKKIIEDMSIEISLIIINAAKANIAEVNINLLAFSI